MIHFGSSTVVADGWRLWSWWCGLTQDGEFNRCAASGTNFTLLKSELQTSMSVFFFCKEGFDKFNLCINTDQSYCFYFVFFLSFYAAKAVFDMNHCSAPKIDPFSFVTNFVYLMLFLAVCICLHVKLYFLKSYLSYIYKTELQVTPL